jgi:DNA-binding transcriptional LysR family regulator
MEWQQILGFHEVARLQSFTRAAEATFRTQSALSQQIKSLEAELGHVLIERIGRRKLRLTAAGEEFLKFAQEVLMKHEFLTESLQGLLGRPHGRLRVAAPFTTLYHLLPPVFRRYLREYPYVQLTILDRPQKTVVELVKSGDVDIGFALESALPSDVVAMRWKKVEAVLMTPIGHPLAREQRVTLEQICVNPLILPPRTSRRTGGIDVEERIRRQGLACHVIMESTNVELSSLYVEMGLGVAFATVVRELPVLQGRRLEFISLDHIFDPDFLAVVTRKGRLESSHKKAFVNLLLSENVETS